MSSLIESPKKVGRKNWLRLLSLFIYIIAYIVIICLTRARGGSTIDSIMFGSTFCINVLVPWMAIKYCMKEETPLRVKEEDVAIIITVTMTLLSCAFVLVWSFLLIAVQEPGVIKTAFIFCAIALPVITVINAIWNPIHFIKREAYENDDTFDYIPDLIKAPISIYRILLTIVTILIPLFRYL